MPTIAREIDALGGTFDGYSDDSGGQYAPAYIDGYNRGHSKALEDANDIAEDADSLVEELLETITNMLDGARPLDRWVADARVLVGRVKHRRNL